MVTPSNFFFIRANFASRYFDTSVLPFSLLDLVCPMKTVLSLPHIVSFVKQHETIAFETLWFASGLLLVELEDVLFAENCFLAYLPAKILRNVLKTLERVQDSSF